MLVTLSLEKITNALACMFDDDIFVDTLYSFAVLSKINWY